MSPLFASLVRTFTPIIVGAVIGWFTALGINLDPEFEDALIVAVTAVFQGVYYVGARLLEKYVSPKFGWLLGLAKQPEYTKPRVDYIVQDNKTGELFVSPGPGHSDATVATAAAEHLRRNFKP